MAISGTPFASSVFSRVTGTLSRSVVLANITRAQQAILKAQEQLSTGNQIIRPSDDPVKSHQALAYQRRIARSAQYVRNMSVADTRLGQTDSTLGDVREVVLRAREIMLSEVQDSATVESRHLSAYEVEELMRQSVAMANIQFENRYLFSGSATERAPFELVNGSVVYCGNTAAINTNISDGITIQTNLTGPDAFGALTAEIEGDADLNPAVVGGTKLADLNGGGGVAAGRILIDSGVTTATVDLSESETVQDVVDKINNFGPAGVTAAINGAANGIALTSATGYVKVSEVDNGTTARDLGLATAGTVTFTALPAIGETITVNGTTFIAGVDFVIGPTTIATAANFAAAVNASPALNGAVSAAQDIAPNDNRVILTATLAAGNVLDVYDTSASITSIEGSGGAGIVGGDTDPSLSLATLRTALRGGAGIDVAPPSGIVINNVSSQAAYNATVDFAGATTLEDMINMINDSGTYVFAEINDDGTGINVVSRLNGARFSIAENGGTTAAELGILLPLSRVRLCDLNNGIGVHSVYGNDFRITLQSGATLEVDVSDAKTVQDVLDLINNHPNNGGALLAQVDPGTGDRLRLTDSSVDNGFSLTVERINGSFAADNLGISGLVANPPGPNPPLVLTGTALNPVGIQTESIFTTLANLRDALRANDRNAISRTGDRIDDADDLLLGARATVGARCERIETMTNWLERESLELEGLLSEIVDADLAEVATRLQLQQTILEAGLAAAARILQTSLLNFM
ncbi:MAG: flagellar hook-associated protein FlgL [Planctomycetota bacterium]|nr:flagellar hook-associated protein FlgL [Planctomycetota bacterium]